MKILKTAALAVLVLLIAAAGGIGWIVAGFDAPRLKREIAAAVEQRTGRTLRIEGDLALGFWPNLAVRLGAATLSEPGGAREFARIGSARVAVAVMPLFARRIEVREVAIDGLAATVIKRKDGTLNVADLLGAPAGGNEKVGADGTVSPTAAPAIDIAAIHVANARLDWRDEAAGSAFSLSDLDLSSGPVRFAAGRGGVEALTLAARGRLDADAFTLRLAAPRLDIAPEGARGETLTLTATLDGKERRLAATLTLADVAGDARTLKIGRFALDADAKVNEAHAVTKLASPVALDLDRRTVALTQLAGRLDLTHPKLPMKTLALPLAGAASADLARQSASLRLDTKLDDGAIKAKLDIGRFAPLALGFDLDIDALDLDKYLPPERKETQDGGGAAGQAPEAKIDLSALKGLDLKGTVNIGRLAAAKLKASDIRARIDARDGRLNVAPLSAKLYDGRLDGALAVDADDNRFAARQTLAGVRVGPLLKDLADKDMLEGRGDVALDVATRGDTAAALRKSLAGTARVALADGAVKGINIGQKLRELRGMLKGGKDVGVASDATQKTDFSELAASFRIANGVARNDDLTAKSPLLRLAGAGDIDIGDERLDYLLKASVVATSKGQGGGELDSLKGLTVPVRLTGPFARPDWKIELAGLAGEAVKAKVEARKEELKQKAEDKLKDRFRGLLGK
jgi:AsmA protein